MSDFIKMSNVKREVLLLILPTLMLSWHREGFSKPETKTQEEKKKLILLSTLKNRGKIVSTFFKKTMQMATFVT